ncbi:MAG: hypothetical protein WCD30_19310 [Pseudolabrys sp.]
MSLPIIVNAQGKRHYCAAAYPKKSGAGRNDQIGSRKGSSHARDDDRYPSFNFAQFSRCGTRSGPAVSEPDDAVTRIGRHGVPAGAGRPSSTDGTLATGADGTLRRNYNALLLSFTAV